MTSLATIIGLMPMALKLGEEARPTPLWPGHFWVAGGVGDLHGVYRPTRASSSHTGKFRVNRGPPELNHLSAKIIVTSNQRESTR